MTMTKNEKLRNTIGYYLLFISLGFGLGITGPALPSLAEQTSSTLGAIGSIFLVGASGGMFGTLIGGRILDHVSKGHFVLGIAQLLSAVFLASASSFELEDVWGVSESVHDGVGDGWLADERVPR